MRDVPGVLSTSDDDGRVRIARVNQHGPQREARN